MGLMNRAQQTVDRAASATHDRMERLKRTRHRQRLVNDLGEACYRRFHAEVSSDLAIDQLVREIAELDAEAAEPPEGNDISHSAA